LNEMTIASFMLNTEKRIPVQSLNAVARKLEI